MIKVKNVRPGILIIPDSRLKLSPGETVEMSEISAQVQRAIDEGLLAKVDREQDAKPRAKAANRSQENNEAGKTEAAGTEAGQPSGQGGDSGKTGEASEPEKKRDTRSKQPIEAESGDK